MSFPSMRPRRLRGSEKIRRLVCETHLSSAQLIMPYFVREGRNKREEIPSMPGQFRYSVDCLLTELESLQQSGVSAVLLFGIPEVKDAEASSAYDRDGVIQYAIRTIKDQFPDLLIIADTCLCEYMSHGHCGIVRHRRDQIEIDNDASLNLLARAAVSQAEAGADMVAPSDMMDGRVGVIRVALDQNDFAHIPIMSYAAKYASAFYGPFREAVGSTPQFGDRKGYQMDFANAREALKEIALDVEEGADIVMVKPALPYLDIIQAARTQFDVPIAAYQVSGEYALIRQAASSGVLDEDALMWETAVAIRRAGADILITYFAKELAHKLSSVGLDRDKAKAKQSNANDL